MKIHPKTPPEVLSPSEMAYMSGLNERDRRLFLATRAESLRSQGLSYRKLAKEWELAHILFKMDCKNCIPASLSNGNASAERVADVMLCCPSILNGFRQQFKS